jgi:hypothetical protein
MTTLLLRYFEAMIRRFDAGTQTFYDIANVSFVRQIFFGRMVFTDFREDHGAYRGGSARSARSARNEELTRRAWRVLDELR